MDMEDVPVVGAGKRVSIQVPGTVLSAALLQRTPSRALFFFFFLIKAKQMIDMLHFNGSSLLYCQKVF